MSGVSIGWLIGLLRLTPRQERTHGPQLDALKHIFERELGYLNGIFAAISAGSFAIFVALVGALIADLSRQTDAGSKTIVTDNETLTENIISGGGFGALDWYLVGGILALVFVSIAGATLNRYLVRRARRGYLNSIIIYAYLNSVID